MSRCRSSSASMWRSIIVIILTLLTGSDGKALRAIARVGGSADSQGLYPMGDGMNSDSNEPPHLWDAQLIRQGDSSSSSSHLLGPGELQEGGSSHLGNDLLSLFDGLQLLSTALGLSCEVLLLRLAILVQLLLCCGVRSELLALDLQVALGGSLLLGRLGDLALRVCELLVGEFDLVSEGLFEHLKVVLGLNLLAARILKLCLSLLLEVLQSLQNASALAGVDGGSWGT
mmetsp:Transcript_51325/g.109134  ORF Transcript_51325/g.109134 Transcript_51325/m.109134 type:complete len:229 (+) Transcript_51325:263-949(+)